MNTKPIFGVDFDDVLFDFNGMLAVFHNKMYGTNYTRADIHSYHLHEVWNCSREEVFTRVSAFYESPDHDKLQPVVGAANALKRLRDMHDVVVVTSRPHSATEITQRLIDRYYPQIFADVIFTNHFGHDAYGGGGAYRTKADVCTEKGISTFVDDSFTYAQDVASCGVRSFLFDTPWNQQQSDPAVERVLSWDDIAHRLSAGS